MFKFNSFVKQSKSNTEGGEGAAATEDLNNTKGPAAEEVKPEPTKGKGDESTKSKWYQSTGAKVALGVVGGGLVLGVAYVVGSALRASDNAAAAAVGDAVAAGASAVADATSTVVGEVVAAARSK